MRFSYHSFWSVACLISAALAYIPAAPVNLTSVEQQQPPIKSVLTLKWQPEGLFSDQVSFLKEANGGGATDEGALVHFSDGANLTNAITTTPWLAFISCDANVTGTALDADIFTSAQGRGAVAALLYSQWSDACTLNPEYLGAFSAPIDLYATKSLSSSRLILAQFTNVDQTLYGDYDPARLNASATAVQAALTQNVANSTYLIAIITSGANSTQPAGIPSPTSTPRNSNSSNQTRGPTTGQSMFILYFIIACISLLF